jgi:hypothetical protein
MLEKIPTLAFFSQAYWNQMGPEVYGSIDAENWLVTATTGGQARTLAYDPLSCTSSPRRPARRGSSTTATS